MPRPFSKRLVIDASIAFAAGQLFAESPVSAACRDFLVAVQEICHRVVVGKELDDEWREHASPFATLWLVQMYQRGKNKYVDLRRRELADAQFRENVEGTQADEGAREAVMKDVHLIEAACATDRIVISCDDRARNHFRRIVGLIGELRRIVWVNPTREAEDALRWLQQGAKPQRERRLSFQAESSK